MDAIQALQGQFHMAHDMLQQMTADLTPEQLQYQAGGRVGTVASNAVHIAVLEDLLLNMFTGGTPLCHGEWAGRTGASELPPFGGGDAGTWDQQVQVDLPQFREYAQAVAAQTMNHLGSLSEADLDRPVDLSGFGMSDQEPVAMVYAIIIANDQWHTGEIATLKGLQGLRGYPF